MGAMTGCHGSFILLTTVNSSLAPARSGARITCGRGLGFRGASKLEPEATGRRFQAFVISLAHVQGRLYRSGVKDVQSPPGPTPNAATQSPPSVEKGAKAGESVAAGTVSPGRVASPKAATAASQAPRPAASAKAGSSLGRAWHIAQLLVCAALEAAAGYAVASLRADVALQQSEQAAQERLSALEVRTQALEAREGALLARRDLHLALLALEERNFGTAERLARKAGEGVGKLGEAYAEPAKSLQGFRPTVSDNISEQRQALLDIARQLDQRIDAPASP